MDNLSFRLWYIVGSHSHCEQCSG